ncbi:MAG: stage V sporulation protein AB [Lachnospiraceae bacterium]|nr:stage V sporulation protein AB [Lachnospiraceae bacterium]
MRILKLVFLTIFAGSYGLLSAAGIFTVLVAVALVPRFAGRTHTANKVLLYEEMLIFGTMLGCVFSVFGEKCYSLTTQLHLMLSEYDGVWRLSGDIFQILFGFFSGMFVGCLALAIAEMLDSIPIFARRISFRHGIGVVVLSMAAGKFCGSIAYFFTKLYELE